MTYVVTLPLARRFVDETQTIKNSFYRDLQQDPTNVELQQEVVKWNAELEWSLEILYSFYGEDRKLIPSMLIHSC
jgi:hypothetical protein